MHKVIFETASNKFSTLSFPHNNVISPFAYILRVLLFASAIYRLYITVHSLLVSNWKRKRSIWTDTLVSVTKWFFPIFACIHVRIHIPHTHIHTDVNTRCPKTLYEAGWIGNQNSSRLVPVCWMNHTRNVWVWQPWEENWIETGTYDGKNCADSFDLNACISLTFKMHLKIHIDLA